jgi:hypothetical protein
MTDEKGITEDEKLREKTRRKYGVDRELFDVVVLCGEELTMLIGRTPTAEELFDFLQDGRMPS